jgi:hypothetical protein
MFKTLLSLLSICFASVVYSQGIPAEKTSNPVGIELMSGATAYYTDHVVTKLKKENWPIVVIKSKDTNAIILGPYGAETANRVRAQFLASPEWAKTFDRDPYGQNDPPGTKAHVPKPDFKLVTLGTKPSDSSMSIDELSAAVSRLARHISMAEDWLRTHPDDQNIIAELKNNTETYESLNKELGLMVKAQQSTKPTQTLNYSHGKYVGEVMNGKAHGVGTYTAAKSGIVYSGQFVADTFSGEGTMTWPNGSKFSGIWKNDSAVSGTIIFANGAMASGTVKNAVFKAN